MTKKRILLLPLLFLTISVFAQREISGVIKDDANVSLAGVSIVVKGTTLGTNTDTEGRFRLSVPQSATTLVVSFIGFATQEVEIPVSNYLEMQLQPETSQLAEVVINVGSRGSQRTLTDSPLPVDILSVNDLKSTGQTTFDKSLQYRVPSFNTVQTPVNDATSLLDPYEIRNMGPSRTLILINGKRKNSSALIYTQTSPGRGESGIDISAIPTDAIKRVEILRDGASAQYGSDAIAGVMNIILKDDYDQGSINLRTGMTAEGDGEYFGIALNNGSKLLKDGFLNYTIDLSKIGLANRPGKVNAIGEAGDFGASLSDVQNFLAVKPDAGNINGSPETTAAKFELNSGLNITETGTLYMNAAYIYKKVNSFANYRTPYWRTLADYPYLADFFPDKNGNYMGYVPTFDGDLGDYNGTVGFKSNRNGWVTDVSLTVGGNRQLWTVRNSHNRNTTGAREPDRYLGDFDGDGVVDLTAYDMNGDLTVDPNEGVELVQGALKYLDKSPITFRAGGVQFNHTVGNIDISKSLSDKITVAFGSEFRSETFETIEGDLASYDAGGADSYAGNSKENSFVSNRYNFGGYLSFGFDLTEDFLIDATGRLENYSDFGDAFVYKLSSRYKFAEDKVTLRGSYSTGFRAPSLHQIYTQKAQYSFVPGQGIQVSGLINNVSVQARLLGIDPLDAEKSTNLTLGLGLNPAENFSVTVDYYNIHVKDRIVLSNEIGPSGDPSATLDQILTDNGIVAVSFFTNSLNTVTSGIDLVANYRRLPLGSGQVSFNLAGNYTMQNERDGAVNNPQIIADAGQSVIDETQEALIFTSRPKFKAILGIDYSLGKFGFSLNNTVFGPTEFRNSGMDANLKVEFATKVVTDLAINYQATDNLMFALNVNNILNVLPEWTMKALNSTGQALLDDTSTNDATYPGLTPKEIQSNLITFNQRYSTMTYDGYHFSQLGTIINFTASLKF